MSSKPNFFPVVGKVTVSIMVQGAGAAVFVPTGRTIGKNPKNYELAQAWARLRTHPELFAHSASDVFRSSIAAVRPVMGPLEAFRGRSLPSVPAPTWRQMGPPPAPSSANRYSCRGSAPLYLCVTEMGVKREVRQQPGERLYLQRFVIPCDALRLADLRFLEDGDFLNDVFFFAEIAASDADAHAGLIFTQVLAELVADTNFDGILVPGIRSNDLTHYANIVVFSPRDWRDWCDKAWTPEIIT